MAETSPFAIRMGGITKRFPGVLANNQIDFSVRQGEIHALLGENGAGKTTLMKILTGLYQPDEGQIWIDGRIVAVRSPRDAIDLGIGMVHQHFMLVESHTVAENIILGLDAPRFVLNLGRVEREIAELADRYRLQVDPRAKIWQLSVGEQQRVEILKALYRGARILVMDEPTAVLTPQEVEELFSTLRSMAAEGHTIIFISHKLREVMSVADRITVLRRGEVVDTVLVRDTSKEDLAQMMVGREVLFRLGKQKSVAGEVVLDIDGLGALSDKGLEALKDVSLTLRRGEILGVAGVAGNGQRELAETIVGLRPVTRGRIRVAGEDVTGHSPRDVIDRGVAYVPEDRMGAGLVMNLSVAENLILRCYRDPPICSGFFLDGDAIAGRAEELVQAYDVMTPGIRTRTRLLSGGNLQKLILAREISSEPVLMVAVYPTRGLDVGATEAVRGLLLEQRQAGGGILLISEDLDELLSMSDRIAVLYEGQIMGVMDARRATVEKLGLMMAGSVEAEVEVAGDD
ncbi:MAG: ABC transporter ATP-binding protein [Anaerolineae bacterium]